MDRNPFGSRTVALPDAQRVFRRGAPAPPHYVCSEPIAFAFTSSHHGLSESLSDAIRELPPRTRRRTVVAFGREQLSEEHGEDIPAGIPCLTLTLWQGLHCVQEVVPINSTHRNPQDARLLDALVAENSSTRFQAALAVGTNADPRLVEVLVARCAIEPDFFVRDMLTWALTRLPAEITVPRLLAELRSGRAQARSQALHTLSKIGDRTAWPAITRSLLNDADDEVARSAWRAAVVLVPPGEQKALATDLAAQLGRGDRNVRLSLSRALVALGDVIEPALRPGLMSEDPEVRAHARATERLLRDPDAGFDLALDEAKRVVALGPERI